MPLFILTFESRSKSNEDPIARRAQQLEAGFGHPAEWTAAYHLGLDGKQTVINMIHDCPEFKDWLSASATNSCRQHGFGDLTNAFERTCADFGNTPTDVLCREAKVIARHVFVTFFLRWLSENTDYRSFDPEALNAYFQGLLSQKSTSIMVKQVEAMAVWARTFGISFDSVTDCESGAICAPKSGVGNSMDRMPDKVHITRSESWARPSLASDKSNEVPCAQMPMDLSKIHFGEFVKNNFKSTPFAITYGPIASSFFAVIAATPQSKHSLPKESSSNVGQLHIQDVGISDGQMHSSRGAASTVDDIHAPVEITKTAFATAVERNIPQVHEEQQSDVTRKPHDADSSRMVEEVYIESGDALADAGFQGNMNSLKADTDLAISLQAESDSKVTESFHGQGNVQAALHLHLSPSALTQQSQLSERHQTSATASSLNLHYSSTPVLSVPQSLPSSAIVVPDSQHSTKQEKCSQSQTNSNLQAPTSGVSTDSNNSKKVSNDARRDECPSRSEVQFTPAEPAQSSDRHVTPSSDDNAQEVQSAVDVGLNSVSANCSECQEAAVEAEPLSQISCKPLSPSQQMIAVSPPVDGSLQDSHNANEMMPVAESSPVLGNVVQGVSGAQQCTCTQPLEDTSSDVPRTTKLSSQCQPCDSHPELEDPIDVVSCQSSAPCQENRFENVEQHCQGHVAHPIQAKSNPACVAHSSDSSNGPDLQDSGSCLESQELGLIANSNIHQQMCNPHNSNVSAHDSCHNCSESCVIPSRAAANLPHVSIGANSSKQEQSSCVNGTTTEGSLLTKRNSADLGLASEQVEDRTKKQKNNGGNVAGLSFTAALQNESTLKMTQPSINFSCAEKAMSREHSTSKHTIADAQCSPKQDLITIPESQHKSGGGACGITSSEFGPVISATPVSEQMETPSRSITSCQNEPFFDQVWFLIGPIRSCRGLNSKSFKLLIERMLLERNAVQWPKCASGALCEPSSTTKLLIIGDKTEESRRKVFDSWTYSGLYNIPLLQPGDVIMRNGDRAHKEMKTLESICREVLASSFPIQAACPKEERPLWGKHVYLEPITDQRFSKRRQQLEHAGAVVTGCSGLDESHDSSGSGNRDNSQSIIRVTLTGTTTRRSAVGASPRSGSKVPIEEIDKAIKDAKIDKLLALPSNQVKLQDGSKLQLLVPFAETTNGKSKGTKRILSDSTTQHPFLYVGPNRAKELSAHRKPTYLRLQSFDDKKHMKKSIEKFFLIHDGPSGIESVLSFDNQKKKFIFCHDSKADSERISRCIVQFLPLSETAQLSDHNDLTGPKFVLRINFTRKSTPVQGLLSRHCNGFPLDRLVPIPEIAKTGSTYDFGHHDENSVFTIIPK